MTKPRGIHDASITARVIEVASRHRGPQLPEIRDDAKRLSWAIAQVMHNLLPVWPIKDFSQ